MTAERDIVEYMARRNHEDGKLYFRAVDIGEDIDRTSRQVGQILRHLREDGVVTIWRETVKPYQWCLRGTAEGLE